MDDDDGTVGEWDEVSKTQLKKVRAELRKEREKAEKEKIKNYRISWIMHSLF